MIGRMNLRRAFRIGLAAVPVALFSGCVQQSTSGTDTNFNYEWWVGTSVLLGGLAALPAGWYLRPKNARFGYGLLVVGVLAVFGFAPSLYLDKIKVRDDGFHVQTGIWGGTVHDVKYDNMASLKLISEESTGRRGRKTTNYFFLCSLKSGESAKVPVNNDVAKAAAESILSHVAERGIPISDEQ